MRISHVYSPSLKNLIKIENSKIPIKSSFIKRLELSHIEKTIDSLIVIPDWGYENNLIQSNNEKTWGWSLIRDFISNQSKYERCMNFV